MVPDSATPPPAPAPGRRRQTSRRLISPTRARRSARPRPPLSRPQPKDHGRLGLSCGAGGAEIQGQAGLPSISLMKRASRRSSRRISRAALAGADRHRLRRRRTAHPDQYSKPIAEHIANSGAYDVSTSSRPGSRRWPNRQRDPADRRLCRQIHEQGRPRRLPPAVQVHNDLQGQSAGVCSTTATSLPSTTARIYSTIRS